MTKGVAWHRSVGVKLGGVVLALLALSLALILADFYTLSSMQGDAACLALFARGRFHIYRILYLAHRLTDENVADPGPVRKDLQDVMNEVDDRYRILLQGDPAQGMAPLTDPTILPGVVSRKQTWDRDIEPVLRTFATTASVQDVKKALPDLDKLLHTGAETLDQGIGQYQASLKAKADGFHWLLYGFGAIVLVVTALVLWIAWGVARRARSLAATADRIAAGDLTLNATASGADELAALGQSFNAMTANLRATIEAEQKRRQRIERLLESVREAVNQLTSASSEILATTTQQAAGAQEQAAAVTETVATVDEVTQTSDQATQRARGMGEAVGRALQVGQSGRQVVEESIAALARVQEQVEATARNILALAEQAQAIGDITAMVADVAEQTNLLALNAAIEAGRAGEHGKGFAVVASEVKALADQSKKATTQVRQILGEIQKATNAAVLSTEEVTKGVVSAGRVADQAGQTIKALAETLAEAAQAASQITASAGQQATGMTQIHQAMRNIDEAARQNLAALQQAEQAAQNLNVLGTRLAALSNE